MGTDKGLVWLNGRPMLTHVLDRVRPLSDSVLITTNNQADYAQFGLPMASDEAPGAGALPGLETALRAATGDVVVLVACDMPFLSTDLLRHQLAISAETDADVVVPRWEKRLQPTHAVYRREPCLAAVVVALAAGEKRMISWFDAVKLVEISAEEVAQFSPDGRTFFNVNTPEELTQAEAMIDAGEV